ncbi:hypothetical protein [Serratia marcescens]|uniref:hypothetical protein n=1 Tax=Serratia marcescens TaxID=615 RepID=UPI00197CC776|nr:hypothetical protein [Serratia marcescens]MBN3978567.1 hypothetical protein [Serratia marcescens]
MNKLREEFEEWFSEKYPLKKPSVRKLKLWEAWRDSRASIVVELPHAGPAEDECDYHYNRGIEATADYLRSIGLSIKGE